MYNFLTSMKCNCRVILSAYILNMYYFSGSNLLIFCNHLFSFITICSQRHCNCKKVDHTANKQIQPGIRLSFHYIAYRKRNAPNRNNAEQYKQQSGNRKDSFKLWFIKKWYCFIFFFGNSSCFYFTRTCFLIIGEFFIYIKILLLSKKAQVLHSPSQSWNYSVIK